MKMIYCTCNVSILEELKELLEKCGVSDFQSIEQVTAKNRKGEPRLNTPVWPGFNAILLAQVREEEKVTRIIQAVRDYNKHTINDDELIMICTWKLEEYIFD